MIEPLLPFLYTYRRCPYAMRARMAMLQAGHAFDACEIVLRDKPVAMLALSPKGTVPVLHLPDGRVLEESWEIMAWAFASNDDEGWWRRGQTPENLELLLRNDGDFKRHLDRYKYPDRFPDENVSRDMERASAVAALLFPLECRLQRERFLGGTLPCATDLAIFPFVRQFAHVAPDGFAEQPLPAVRAWLEGWLTHPLFETCMTKLAPQSVVAFPSV